MNETFAAFAGNAVQIARVYADGRREQIAAQTNLFPHLVTRENFAAHATALRDVEVLFSTWGMAQFDDELDQLPHLKAVFYAAGSVQFFARPFLERGITVVSAWQANGVPVAEFTLAQILLANKGYFANTRHFKSRNRRSTAPRGRGNFGACVALLGAGAIGRLVIELLRPFQLKIIVFDPFLSDESAAQLGVEKVSLAEAFARGNVVSNHLANNPQTRGLLCAEHFAAMPDGATFINTGRGATVDEDGMIGVLRQRPDLIALLDVTDPEPPAENSPFYELPNVQLSTHIAGSLGDEVVRLADYVIEDFKRWQRGEPLHFAVAQHMLETMA